jgi:ComF family protein
MPGIHDLYLLFFPSTCLLCGKRISDQDVVLCFTCELKMPKTYFPDEQNNPVSRIFWGRVPVQAGTSLFRFEKGSACQALIHELKYRRNAKAGIYLGRLLGRQLRAGIFSDCDLMVPVPLHQKKLKQRGYNQSELIARGVSEITGIPLASTLIRRIKYQHSQTSMNRQERFNNMAKAFACGKIPAHIRDKKILLIDDTITTGATLEACCMALLHQYPCTICVATVSYA